MRVSPIRKYVFVSAGVVCVGLAMLGLFLPLLPTTPFLLLAAALFMRSSDRLYRWLTTHRWFGSYIRNYREHRAVSARAKVAALALLWATIGYTAWKVVDSLGVRILLLLIAAGVTVHLLSLRTLTPEMMNASEAPSVEHDDSACPD